MDRNPLVRESDLQFLLREVFEVERLCALEPFSHLDLDTFELYISATRTLARERLYPLYREMDQAPPTFDGAHVATHPHMVTCYDQLAELGVIVASRPEEVGGAALPRGWRCFDSMTSPLTQSPMTSPSQSPAPTRHEKSDLEELARLQIKRLRASRSQSLST